MKNQNALELTPDQIGEETLTYSPSKMIVWTLLLIAPPLSLADTEIVDIGSQHLVLASGLKSAASEPTPVLPKNIRSDPATLKAANAEEEEDCD